MILEKWCRSCHVVKSTSDFNPSKVVKDGYMSYCKECSKELSKAWRKSKGQAIPASRHRLSIKEYNQYFERAGYVCSNMYCDSTKNLVLDHSHATGKIRGVLCHKCNVALGMAEDSDLKLSGLMRYLNERS